MTLDLFPFQQAAVTDLHYATDEAIANYAKKRMPQVISFTAPTGAGKTIIMASLIEDIYKGTTDYPEQPEAIFIWLSDSPELNKQSKDKIESRTDYSPLKRCVIIDDASFDKELLDDGHVYFLNTQKLGKGSNLTQHKDTRTYTIWETLENTIREKFDRVYVIIDEAHRGMLGKEASKATTIMQRFLKGDPSVSLDPMPVVIGMSATTERFNSLVSGIKSTTQYVIVTPDDVRDSGLLKDRIIIKYPGESAVNKEMAILQVAAREWKEKCEHWERYCNEINRGKTADQREEVKPVFVVQVENASEGKISATDLTTVLKNIEESTGYSFAEYEVVHTFGMTETEVIADGLTIYYEEPSHISDNEKVKVVFFKENLSVGWDCPRAETMMSFRKAVDYTYIAQLLGRMIRTPLHRHIDDNEALNEVTLFLPYFDKNTVDKVIKALKGSEGASLPTDVEGQEIGNKEKILVSAGDGVIRWKKPVPQTPRKELENQISLNEEQAHKDSTDQEKDEITDSTLVEIQKSTSKSEEQKSTPKSEKPTQDTTSYSKAKAEEKTEATLSVPTSTESQIKRAALVDFINGVGLTTYTITKHHISNYLSALFDLVRLLTYSGLAQNMINTTKAEFAGMIESYISNLKSKGDYDDLVNEFQDLIVTTQIFDAFGEEITTLQNHLFATTSDDVERQFRRAEHILANEGIGQEYRKRHFSNVDPNAASIDVILFSNDEKEIANIRSFAERKYNDLKDNYRIKILNLDALYKSQFANTILMTEDVAELSYTLPKAIYVDDESFGEEYTDHLFINDKTSSVRFNLDSWEKGVLEEERQRVDYVCFVRNKERKPWALRLVYTFGHETKPMYPDFLIIRDVPDVGFVVDILEPHRGDLTDNLPKALGLIKYAKKNPRVGRIQMIREGKNGAGKKCFFRLDFTKTAVQNAVLSATTDAQFDQIFNQLGFWD